MKRTNNFFHKGLYLETLRYLKVVGIVAIVIFGLIAIIPYLGNYIQSINDSYDNVHKYLLKESMSYLQVLYYIFVPVMMAMTFSFLNKRHKCDFYHAIPVKRGAIYCSMVLAVLTWCVIIIASASLIFFGIIGILPNMAIEWKGTGLYIMTVFAGCLLVAGAVALGMSLTGTGFTNVIATLMIIFVPRFFIQLSISGIETYAPFAVIDSSSFIFALENNIVLEQFMGDFFFYSASDEWFRWGAVAYTSIIGLIYFGFGSIAFIRRKSETASSPSVNSVLQTAFRMVPAYFIGLTPVIGIYETYRNGEWLPVNIFYIVAIYLVCIVAYFLYELITTRRIKKTFASVKQLPFLVALHTITLVGIIIITNVIMGYRPDKEKVTSVVIEECDNYREYTAFAKLIPSDKVIEDDNVIEILVDCYDKAVENFNDTHSIYELRYEIGLDYEMTVVFNEGNTSHRRLVMLSKGDYIKLLQAINEKEPGTSSLPQYNDNMSFYDNNAIFSDDMYKNIYNSLYEELKGSDGISKMLVSDDRIISRLEVNYNNYYESADKISDFSVPISTLTPKTLELYEKYSKECSDITFSELPEKLSESFVAELYYRIIIESENGEVMYFSSNEWADTSDIVLLLSRVNMSEYSVEKTDEPYTLYIVASSFVENENGEMNHLSCFEHYYITEAQLKDWVK